MEDKELLDPWYVTGLIEGEGSFTYSRSGKSWVMIFAVKLNTKNQALLQELLDFFMVGKIYNLGDKGGIYRVSKQEELAQIIEHFERFPLRGAKSASYQLWRQMVDLKAQSFRKPPHEELEEFSRQLSASSIRG
jgi:hypothetical protein